MHAENTQEPSAEKLVAMAIELDAVFDLVDRVLAGDPETEALRVALSRTPVRCVCRMVRVARG